MQFYGGFYYPDREKHMIDWVEKHGVSMYGRTAYQGAKQKRTIDLCRKLGRLGVAVDVGAHIGTWSYNLCQHFRQVIAFEPVAEHRECFVMNMDPKLSNWMLHECALGANEGMIEMKVEAGNSGNSSVKPNTIGDIPLRMLDGMIPASEMVDLIKIDTEGFEAQVIAGGRATIERCRPVIIAEQKRDFATKYGNKPTAAVDALKELGYRVVADIGGDFLCVHGSIEVPK